MDETAWARSRFEKGLSEFMLLSPIRRGRIPGERRTYLQRVEETFDQLVSRYDAGIPTPLTSVPTIHFARWALIRPEQLGYPATAEAPKVGSKRSAKRGAAADAAATAGAEITAAAPKDELQTWLLTVVVFDGEASVYSRELSAMIGDQLDNIFGNCDGYPPDGAAADSEGVWKWFRQYQLPTEVFHASYHLSVVRIHMLELFKARFDAFVASVLGPDGKPVGDTAAALNEFLRKNQQYASGFPASGGTYPRVDGKTESCS